MCASVRACVRACVQTSARLGRPDVRGGEAACARLVQSPRRRRRPVRLMPRHPGRRRSAIARPTQSAGPWSARLRRYLRRKGTLCTVRRAVLAGGTRFVVSAALRLQRRHHSCTGTDLAAATSAPGPGSPQPHLHRDRARPPTSAPGLGSTCAVSAARCAPNIAGRMLHTLLHDAYDASCAVNVGYRMFLCCTAAALRFGRMRILLLRLYRAEPR